MDLDRDARRILELANAEREPAAGDKARIASKLGVALGAAALAGGATTAAATQSASAAPAAASTAALKWWVLASIVAVAVTGSVMLLRATPAPAPSPPIEAPAPITLPAPEVEPPAVVPQIEPEPEPVVEPEVEPQRPARATRKQAGGATLSEELELLHRAQAAWRAHDAASALELLDQHRARFPRSQLRLEREGLRVLTLCELGQKDEASALARRLLERAPRSPLRYAIEESCALK